MDLSINYHPTADELKVIDRLLKKEPNWLDNWKSIKKKQKTEPGTVFTLLCDGKPIGFRSQYYYDGVVYFLVFWIDKSYRRKGLGIEYFHMLLEHFSEEGYIAVVAHPVTDDGMGFCRKAGFVPRHVHKNDFDDEFYYLPVPPYTLPEVRSELADNYLKASYRYNVQPFYLSLDRDFTAHPAVYDIPYDYEVEICVDGKKTKKDVIKYLSEDMHLNYRRNSEFIILDKNIELPPQFIKQ